MKNKEFIIPDEVKVTLYRIKEIEYEFSTNYIDNEIILFMDEKESNREDYNGQDLTNLYYKCKRELKLKNLLDEK